MTPDETARVLAKCAAYDRRTIGKTDVAAWHEALADLDLAEGLSAVAAWYAEHREFVMPADIRRIARPPLGTDPDWLPCARPAAEALAAAERGRGDQLAADRHEPPPAIEGPAPRTGREALTAAQAWAAGQPTGYVRRRGQPAGRAAADSSKRLAGQQRDRRAPVVDGRTDAARADAGKAITICHSCAADIPAPDGWDPGSPDSPPLHCARCTPAEQRRAS